MEGKKILAEISANFRTLRDYNLKINSVRISPEAYAAMRKDLNWSIGKYMGSSDMDISWINDARVMLMTELECACLDKPFLICVEPL